MEIILRQGIGPIRLGMHPHEVKDAFPEPHLVERWSCGNENGDYFYQGLRLRFDGNSPDEPPPDSRLFSIEVYQRKDASIFGKPVDEWTPESIWDYLVENGYSPVKEDNGDYYAQGLTISGDGDGPLFLVIE